MKQARQSCAITKKAGSAGLLMIANLLPQANIAACIETQHVEIIDKRKAGIRSEVRSKQIIELTSQIDVKFRCGARVEVYAKQAFDPPAVIFG